MKRRTNQDIERHYFELFRGHYSVPSGTIEYSDKPDVIVRGVDVLGVEIERLYILPGGDPSSEQVQRTRRLRVLKLAQKMYLVRGGRHFELSVDFDPHCPITDERAVADALVNLAKRVENQQVGQIDSQLLGGHPQLRQVFLNPREYSDAQWRVTQVHGVPLLDPQRVIEAISDKSKKSAAYQTCDRYWLLLVVDFMDAAQDQSLEWPSGLRVGTSAFERVLLYKPQFGETFEVPQ